MNASNHSAPSAKPRFSIRCRNGQPELLIRLPMEPEDLQALQRQLSRGTVAALVRDILRLAKLPNPQKT